MQDPGRLINPVVLAAGTSSRMGVNKLLIPIRGKPMLHWVVETLHDSGFNSVMVVTGFEAEAVASSLSSCGSGVQTVHNPRFMEGRTSSIRAALDVIGPTDSGLLLTPGDVPFISRELVRELCLSYRQEQCITFPLVEGRKGHPVIFPPDSFELLRNLTKDNTLHDYMLSSQAASCPVPWDEPGCLQDFDTPESLSGPVSQC